MKLVINPEARHHQWFAEVERYAWRASGNKRSTMAVMEGISKDEPIQQFGSPEESLLNAIFDDHRPKYQSVGKFDVPDGSSSIIYTLARHTLGSPLSVSVLEGVELDQFPYETFCLGELLQASFPRETATGVIKHTMGGLAVTADLVPPDEQADPLNRDLMTDLGLHKVFAGLGIILMRNVRELVGPMLSDDEVVQVAKKRELYLVEIR